MEFLHVMEERRKRENLSAYVAGIRSVYLLNSLFVFSVFSILIYLTFYYSLYLINY